MVMSQLVLTVCGLEGLLFAYRGNNMNIRVKLFATFREGRGKEVILEADEGATTSEILDRLGIDIKDVAILLVNGKSGRADQVLYENDLISVFPPIGGG
jgi:molybdopterin converting factor small subunit